MKIKLATMRTKRQMNQSELSRSSGVPQPMISDIENGNVLNPTIKTLSKLARALRCLIDDLIEEEQETRGV